MTSELGRLYPPCPRPWKNVSKQFHEVSSCLPPSSLLLHLSNSLRMYLFLPQSQYLPIASMLAQPPSISTWIYHRTACPLWMMGAEYLHTSCTRS